MAEPSGVRQAAVGRLRPARRVALSDDVYETLKRLVMGHAIAPGDRLSIDGLARTLDVSPTPIREALARLESDGLVRKRAMAGYTTTPLLTRDEFEDLFDVRLLLEPAAAQRAADWADAESRSRLSTEAATSVPASSAAFTDADARFHELVAAASGSELLREAVARLHAHLHLHRLFFPSKQTGDTAGEHQRVARAIESGEPTQAGEAMRRHLVASRERHLPAFG